MGQLTTALGGAAGLAGAKSPVGTGLALGGLPGLIAAAMQKGGGQAPMPPQMPPPQMRPPGGVNHQVPTPIPNAPIDPSKLPPGFMDDLYRALGHRQ